MILWPISSLFLLIPLTVSELDTKKIPRMLCQDYVDCRRSVLQRLSQCSESFPNSTVSKIGNDTRKQYCLGLVEPKMRALHSLRVSKHLQQLDCVDDHRSEAAFVNPKKVRACKKILDDYTRFANTSSLNTTNTPLSLTSTDLDRTDNDYYFENLELQLERRSQQVYLRGRQRRRRDKHVTTTRQECRMKVSQLNRHCELLSSCCSEVTRCDNDYESSTLHTEIRQLQLEIFNQLRQCQT